MANEAEMDRSKQLVKNTIIISFGTFLPKLIALITTPIVTGSLSKSDFGTYDLLSTIAALYLPIVTVQIHSAAFRYLIDCRNDKKRITEIISTIFCFVLFTSIVSLLALNIWISCFSLLNLNPLLVGIYLLVDILLICTQQIIRGLSKNKLYSISAIANSFLYGLFLTIFLKYTQFDIDGFIISFIIGSLVGILILLVSAKLYKYISFKAFSLSNLKRMLLYSWPMVPNNLSSWVLNASDRLVVTYFLGIEDEAVYAVSNKIPHLLAIAQSTFIFAWQENASLALSDSDVESYYSDMFDKIFSILTGFIAGLIGATPILFWLLIKGDYKDAYPQMPILFMGMYFSALSAFLGGIYVAHKRTKNVGLTTMLAATCNLFIDFAFVKTIGIYAASISTLASYMLLAIYRMHDVKKFQRITYKHKKIIICLSVLVGMCVLCWVNISYLNIFNLILGCAVATIFNWNFFVSILKTMKIKYDKSRI